MSALDILLAERAIVRRASEQSKAVLAELKKERMWAKNPADLAAIDVAHRQAYGTYMRACTRLGELRRLIHAACDELDRLAAERRAGRVAKAI